MLTKEQDRIRKQLIREKQRDDISAELYRAERFRTEKTQEGYAEFLRKYYWEDFLTVTFRDARKEPYYAAKNVWGELKKYNAIRAFLAVEPHQSGDLHIHGLCAGALKGWLIELKVPWDIYAGLFKRFGRSRVEACRSDYAVSMYCAKYLRKQQSRVCDYYYIFGEKIDWNNGLIDSHVIMN